MVEIEDRPGVLAQVAQIVGDAGGNILEVSHIGAGTGCRRSARFQRLFIDAMRRAGSARSGNQRLQVRVQHRNVRACFAGLLGSNARA